MKYIFILNERAGKGKCTKILPNIEKACRDRNIDFEIRYISKEKSGYDIALKYKDKDYYIIQVLYTHSLLLNIRKWRWKAI